LNTVSYFDFLTVTSGTYFCPAQQTVHFMHIIHRDLKPENILLTASNHAVIGDFSISYSLDAEIRANRPDAKDTGNAILTPVFTPPELLIASNSDSSASPSAMHLCKPAIDIWALGITLYSFLHGHLPFESTDMSILYDQIARHPIEPKLSDTVSPEAKDLLTRMLEKNPRDRLSLLDIKSHPWTTSKGRDPMLSLEENCAMVTEGAKDSAAYRDFRMGAAQGTDADAAPLHEHDRMSGKPGGLGRHFELTEDDLREAVKPAVTFWDRLKDRLRMRVPRKRGASITHGVPGVHAGLGSSALPQDAASGIFVVGSVIGSTSGLMGVAADTSSSPSSPFGLPPFSPPSLQVNTGL
jgi:hypothetical protein